MTAIPSEKFNFIKWSDGVITPSRTEYNVTEIKLMQSLIINVDLTKIVNLMKCVRQHLHSEKMEQMNTLL